MKEMKVAQNNKPWVFCFVFGSSQKWRTKPAWGALKEWYDAIYYSFIV